MRCEGVFFLMKETAQNQGLFIPKKILQNKQLNVTEKLLYAQICFYCHLDKNGDMTYCKASNNYLSNYLSISLRTLNRTLQSLIDKKLIMISKYRNNDNKRVIQLYDKRIIEHYKKGFYGDMYSMTFKE